MARKTDLPKHIVHTALDLAVSRGWYNTSLADIAAAAKVPLAQLHAIYPSKGAIVAAFSKQIDEQVLAAVAEEEEAEGSPRDRLFDVLMQRFDALKPHKATVEAIFADAGRDPPKRVAAARADNHAVGQKRPAGDPASEILVGVDGEAIRRGTGKRIDVDCGYAQFIPKQSFAPGRNDQVYVDSRRKQAFDESLGIQCSARTGDAHDNSLV